jgi:cold shock CspA family protein
LTTMATRSRGVIKAWVDERGFGWARRSPESDVFVHISAVPYDLLPLHVNDAITFEVIDTGKGPRAVDVRLDARRTRA